MSIATVNSKAFTAHLYLNGRPLVLNQQRLQQVLRDLRITRGEQLEAEVGLADSRVASFITLANHDDDKPLLLKFVPQGERYAISLVHPGVFDGARLFIEDKTHNLLASTSAPLQHFSFSTSGVPKASLGHFEAGPAYLELNRETDDKKSSSKPLYRSVSSGMSTFLDVDPNPTGHNAFNSIPAIFVIKVVG
ncbi:hypothetical protein [Pseudomonas fluorescens]|uniref:hypothetical protein n=1 Tax=Pseudomonas fluorescens TaxID=294 RepID=UPI00124023A8|nr:hypothetical protein [Pseudomonas fluorescens]VVQ36361.1 hypothetical protein PS947_05006 [Pseudomonas fluorescens]